MKIKRVITKHFFLIFFIAMTLPSFAQEISVTGKITDEESGEPLPGVSILQIGTNQGTTTDSEGEYSINVPSDAKLEFSFVGYVTQRISVEGESEIDVQMKTKAEELDEVVVIGYGEVSKEDATGSLSKISTEDFQKGEITSPQKLLQGKIPGVQVTSGGGAPGSGAQILIRGGSSMTASNDPMIVIDGVPVDSRGISGMRNPLNSINPSDIQDMTVLKDASATAIYGSRAANGVIMITTKEGKKGQRLSIGYNGETSISTASNKIDVMDADEFTSLIQERFPDYEDNLGNADTDWQDEIFQNAFSHKHNLDFTGAFNDIPYRASIGYNNNEGILKTSSMERTTGSIKLTPSFFEEKFKVNFNVKGVNVQNQFADEGAIGNAVTFDPTQPVYDEDSEYGGYYTWTQENGNPITIAPANPMAMLKLQDDNSNVNRAIGNLKLDYNLHFLPEVTASLNFGYDYSDSEGSELVPRYASWVYDSDPNLSGGIDREYEQEKRNKQMDFYLNYKKDLNEISSKIDFMAGYSYEHFWQSGYTYETNHVDPDLESDSTIVNTDTDYENEHYLISFFGRMNYTFKDRYLLTLTLRRDGTSRFSEDNRWALFPSAAFAWQIHEEQFMQKMDNINELKLRLGYGVTGQQELIDDYYPYIPRYTYGEDDARYQFGDEFVTTIRPEAYNTTLKWEETVTYNAGLDFGIYDNRLMGSLDIYYKKTEDLLNTVPVSAGTNFTNRILANVGSVENRGFELQLTGRPISEENLFWEINTNFTYNKNEITKLTTVDDPGYEGVLTGGIAGGTGNTIQIHSVGHPLSTFYVFEQVYDENGDPIEDVYVDQNGDGRITEKDKYRYKSPKPSFTMGLSSTLRYKNWDFSLSGRMELDRYVYNNVSSTHTSYSEVVNQTGYLTNVTADIDEKDFNNTRYHSDIYIENASFFRLDNVSTGYLFENLYNDRLDIRLSATVENVLLISDYSGLDPEISNGIDNNFYPRPTTFLLGVNLSF
ncbi:MAG: SusC/RagA family TonB-linked outer membrane protein [Bacteroidota bacterium]